MNFKVKKIGQYKVILDNNNDPIDVWDEEDMSYDVNEDFDPDSWEGEMEWEFVGDDGEPGYGGVRYTVVVDKEQNKAFVDPKSLNAWCNGDGNNKLTDEWCTSMVQTGGELHNEALQAAQEDVDEVQQNLLNFC